MSKGPKKIKTQAGPKVKGPKKTQVGPKAKGPKKGFRNWQFEFLKNETGIGSVRFRFSFGTGELAVRSCPSFGNHDSGSVCRFELEPWSGLLVLASLCLPGSRVVHVLVNLLQYELKLGVLIF